MKKLFFKCLLVAAVAAVPGICVLPAHAEDVAVGLFSQGDLSGWEEKVFKGKTDYRIVNEGERLVLRAESKGAASGLFKKISVNLERFPVMKWSWKIGATISKGDARTKDGDDYAARVYVVFPGTFFWQTTSIDYIWANKLPAGSSIGNAYAPGNVKMIAVDSGMTRAGRWVEARRNVLEDYRRLFGQDPPELGAVAIMTDTDNTGESVTAFYGDIVLSSE